jgi:hypothetical protein
MAKKSAKKARKAMRARKATPARKTTKARKKTTTRARTTKPRSKPPGARTRRPARASVGTAGSADAAGAFFAIILDSQPRVPDLRLTHQGPDLQTVRAFTQHDGSLGLVPADQFRTSRIEPKSLIFTPTGRTDPGAIFQLTPREN